MSLIQSQAAIRGFECEEFDISEIALANGTRSGRVFEVYKAFPDHPKPMLLPIKHLLKFVHFSDVMEGGKDFRIRFLGDAVFLDSSKARKVVL